MPCSTRGIRAVVIRNIACAGQYRIAIRYFAIIIVFHDHNPRNMISIMLDVSRRSTFQLINLRLRSTPAARLLVLPGIGILSEKKQRRSYDANRCRKTTSPRPSPPVWELLYWAMRMG